MWPLIQINPEARRTHSFHKSVYESEKYQLVQNEHGWVFHCPLFICAFLEHRIAKGTMEMTKSERKKKDVICKKTFLRLPDFFGGE